MPFDYIVERRLFIIDSFELHEHIEDTDGLPEGLAFNCVLEVPWHSCDALMDSISQISPTVVTLGIKVVIPVFDCRKDVDLKLP